MRHLLAFLLHLPLLFFIIFDLFEGDVLTHGRFSYVTKEKTCQSHMSMQIEKSVLFRSSEASYEMLLLNALSLLNIPHTHLISHSLAYPSIYLVHLLVGLPAVFFSLTILCFFLLLAIIMIHCLISSFCFSFYQTLTQLSFSYQPTHGFSFSVSPPTLSSSFLPFPVCSIYHVKSMLN